MATQSKHQWYWGSGKEGEDREERFFKAAKALGYSGPGAMATDMVEWVIANGEWEKGKGLVGLKKRKP